MCGRSQCYVALVGLMFTLNGANPQITVQSVNGRLYQLQRSDTLALGSWVNVGNTQTGTGGAVILTDTDGTAGVPKRFYRVMIQP
jgi:hypothetical protein